jgi:GNAT superfamily N-acetyltransferase
MPDSTADILIRPITPADAEAFRAMRLEAVRRYPLAFTSDLATLEARTLDAWREQVGAAGGDGDQVIMVADATAAGGTLAGMAGVFTPEQPKLNHVGTVWGVYVREPFRGVGLGDALLRACVDWARRKGLVMLKLSVVAGNDAAHRCYARRGFTAYGVEPNAVRWEGKLYDETLMALRL